jgi:hypothetical protein
MVFRIPPCFFEWFQYIFFGGIEINFVIGQEIYACLIEQGCRFGQSQNQITDVRKLFDDSGQSGGFSGAWSAGEDDFCDICGHDLLFY